MSIKNAIRRGVRRALHEQDEQLSDVDVEEGEMHDLLGVDQDENISDVYTDGEQLARDLVDATGDEQEASGMIAYAANINPEDNVFDEALEAIGEIDFEEQKRRGSVVRQAVREAIQEVLTEQDDYQEFFQGVMDTLNIDDPSDLTDEGKQKFFSFLDSYYDEETDDADEYNKEDLKGLIEPGHYEDESKAPDFLKERQKVREMAQTALKKALLEAKRR